MPTRRPPLHLESTAPPNAPPALGDDVAAAPVPALEQAPEDPPDNPLEVTVERVYAAGYGYNLPPIVEYSEPGASEPGAPGEIALAELKLTWGGARALLERPELTVETWDEGTGRAHTTFLPRAQAVRFRIGNVTGLRQLAATLLALADAADGDRAARRRP